MRILSLFVLFVAVYAKHEQYSGWKSYYVGPPATQEELKKLVELEDVFFVDTLSHATINREGVVLVKPQYEEKYIQALAAAGIRYKIHKADVKAALDYDDVLLERSRATTRLLNGGRDLPYETYQDWDVIESYILDVAERHPDTVTLVTPANSFQGRPLRYLKISTTNFEDISKPVIFIDGGIHAREWITAPVMTYAIRKLTDDITEPDLLESFDWIIFPVVNPDGYQYTHTTSRMWRKTMSTNTHSLSFLCPGVDGNRNYDFFWNTVGTSSSPCTDTYAGNTAFSEIETRVVRDIITENLSRMALYLTMHSYGSMILYPWGHDGSLSGNAFALHLVGVGMAEAIDRVALASFPNYIVGNSVLVIGYPAAGASEDYAHLAGVPLSYTYELPGLGGGFDGFHLDPQYIPQVSMETWEGIVVGARRAGQLF